jgi:hypothetical protein
MQSVTLCRIVSIQLCFKPQPRYIMVIIAAFVTCAKPPGPHAHFCQHLPAACESIHLDFRPYMTALTLLLGTCSGVPAMVPTMVKLPGQSRSMIQLLPPPADLDNPLTAVDIARSAEVNKLQTLPEPVLLANPCGHLCCDTYPSSYPVCLAPQAITALFQTMYKLYAPVYMPLRTHIQSYCGSCTVCHLAICTLLTQICWEIYADMCRCCCWSCPAMPKPVK